MFQKACLFLFWVCGLSYAASGQSISNERIKDILRTAQLNNAYRPDASLTINANQVLLKEVDSALGIKQLVSPFSGTGKNNFQFLPATLVQQYNSVLPYDWNNGSMIPAKGYQL